MSQEERTECSGASHRITSTSNERTFARLLETLQMVLDVLDCTAMPPRSGHETPECAMSQKLEDRAAYLEPGGYAWRTVVNVRLLHGVARMRVRERWQREGKQDLLDGTIPINQEELSAT